MNSYKPRPEDKFTFGLWTVGNRGRDPFGDQVREKIEPEEIVSKLSSLGAYGVNLHDNDLVPFGSSAWEQNQIISSFRKSLADNGMKVPMVTTNLFFDPAFKEGAFTALDPRVRRFAIQKAMKAMDLGKELGAKIFVCWGGREGVETDATKDPREALKWYREAFNFLCKYNRDQRYGYKFALEAKPNEPRSDLYLPTTGAILAFIQTLDHPDMVGVNPEVAHENMSGLNMTHAVAQALDMGKLFHIDLNAQKIGRYDQDLRFGSEDLKGAFFLIKLLDDARWNGFYHFDSHAYRTEDIDGVWDFAAASMRTVLILKDKVRQFNKHPEIQSLLRDLGNPRSRSLAYTKKKAAALKNESFDLEKLRERGYRLERLDQLVMEILMGVR